MALHWRVLAAHVAAHSGVSERERIFESLLPELPKLGMLLSVAAVARDAPFLMRQLLALVMCVDVADESGRRQLQGALLRLMPQWRDESVLTAFVRALRHVTPDEDEFIREVIGVVSELRDPLEPEFDADADDGAQSQSQSDAPWSPRAHGMHVFPTLSPRHSCDSQCAPCCASVRRPPRFQTRRRRRGGLRCCASLLCSWASSSGPA